jgi:hypothetical protein
MEIRRGGKGAVGVRGYEGTQALARIVLGSRVNKLPTDFEETNLGKSRGVIMSVDCEDRSLVYATS